MPKNNDRVECPTCKEACQKTMIMRAAYECRKCGLTDVIDRKDIDRAVSTATKDAVAKAVDKAVGEILEFVKSEIDYIEYTYSEQLSMGTAPENVKGLYTAYFHMKNKINKRWPEVTK